MAEDKIDETDEGYYVQVGDVLEWHWKSGHEPKVAVPEGEFDPRDVVSTKTAAAVVPPKQPAAKKATKK